MALTFWYHPFSSFCRKALIGLYECGADFDGIVVDFGDETSRADFFAVWPLGKFPVLRDETSGELMPESTIIIEYLADRFPTAGLIPTDPAEARRVRFLDRFFDNYIHHPMQGIVADRLRSKDDRDPTGVEQYRRKLRTAYPWLEQALTGRRWAAGDGFTLADCAAQPALHFAQMVEPWKDCPAIDTYLARLRAHPSVAKSDAQAQPYAHFFPQE